MRVQHSRHESKTPQDLSPIQDSFTKRFWRVFECIQEWFVLNVQRMNLLLWDFKFSSIIVEWPSSVWNNWGGGFLYIQSKGCGMLLSSLRLLFWPSCPPPFYPPWQLIHRSQKKTLMTSKSWNSCQRRPAEWHWALRHQPTAPCSKDSTCMKAVGQTKDKIQFIHLCSGLNNDSGLRLWHSVGSCMCVKPWCLKAQFRFRLRP